MTPTQFAFIDWHEFDNGQAFRGAALVTDSATEPLEFRCTSPVRPTLLQRTLWGKRLLGHVACHLVGKPLLEALTSAAVLIVVRKPELVELREIVETPLVQVLRNQDLTMASPLTSTERDGDMLENGATQFEPLILKVHRKHDDDKNAARELPVQSVTATKLRSCLHQSVMLQEHSAQPAAGSSLGFPARS